MADALTPAQRATLLSVLAEFADNIERVDIYGSRARGTHRAGSDVDLIIVGAIDPAAKSALELALEESDLSLFADVKIESELIDSELAREIARDRRILFSHGELASSSA